MVVGPGEAARWLEEALRQIHWCDAIAVVLNNATDAERAVVHRYATFWREDNREWGKEQWRIKQDFLKEVVRELAPDWIWTLDADEIFDPRFDRAQAEAMTKGNDVAWYFWCLQLWNDPGQVRIDMSFPNIRFYKVVPELGLHFLAQPVHCGLAPMYAYRFGSQSGLYFKHYGLMKGEDRARKIARYDRYDPNAVCKGKSWYDSLRNEKAHAVPLAEAIRRLPEFIYRNKPVTAAKNMQKDRKLYMFMNKHGKVVEAVGQRQREQFLTHGLRELVDLQVNPNPEAPVVPSPTPMVVPENDETDLETTPPVGEGSAEEPENIGFPEKEVREGKKPVGDKPKAKKAPKPKAKK